MTKINLKKKKQKTQFHIYIYLFACCKQDVLKQGVQQQVVIGLGAASGISFTPKLLINQKFSSSQGNQESRTNGNLQKCIYPTNLCLQPNSEKNENKTYIYFNIKNYTLNHHFRSFKVPRNYYYFLIKKRLEECFI